MTERQPVDNASVGNSTISTVTMMENADDLVLLAKADNKSVGDGGSSDAEGDGEFECSVLEEGAQQAAIERRDNDNANIEENVINTDFNYTKSLPGSPEDWTPPQPPEGWVHKADTERGEPLFSQVDNPGGWSPYTFRAKFTARGKKGTYTHHEMPDRAQVVPINAAGHREVNGWRFHYKGWRHHLEAGDFWRNGATRDSIFPEDRKSKLDGKLLKEMGLNRERIIAKDALFLSSSCSHSPIRRSPGYPMICVGITTRRWRS